ncbi:MAG: MFS transporter [Armatimonadetes bacterium]|nr:MFS transporter [Anaerolineae bacterium]
MAQGLAAAPRVPTFAALQNTNFRVYFIGQLISTSGTWMQNVALGYLVFQLTQSELMLGIVACAAGIPMLLIAPFAGVIVGRMPRQRVLLLTQIGMMLPAFALVLLVITDSVQVWLLLLLALWQGAVNAFDAPARQIFIADLIDNAHLPSGIAMNSMIINGSRVFGPALAGVLLLTLGAAWCFLLNGLSFLFVIGTLALIQLGDAPQAAGRAQPLAELRAGLQYVRGHSVVLPLLMLSSSGGFSGWALLALLPAFADEVLKSPEEGYAIISAANGFGSVVAGLLVGYLGHRIGRGRVLLSMGVLVGVAMAMLSQMTSIPAAAAANFVLGFATISFLVTVNTSVQLTIPNAMRGRVMSLYTLTIIGLNPFGALLLGVLAEATSNPTALLIYAAAFTLVCALVFTRYPQVRRIGLAEL